MYKHKKTRINKYLNGSTLIVMVLFLCFSMRSSIVRAKIMGTEPQRVGSLSIKGQSWSKSGWFSIIWGDAPDGTSSTIYTLTDDFGQTTGLLLDETLAKSQGEVLSFNRKYVNIQGVLPASYPAQSAFAVLKVSSISLAQSPEARVLGGIPTSEVTGSQPWITIMCKYSDHAEEPKNLAYFQGMYASTKPGLDHYWREQSYDTINLVGSDAAGWFVLPHPVEYYDIDWGLYVLAHDCIASADANVDFSLYVGINMFFNTDYYGCWGGRCAHDPGWCIKRLAHDLVRAICIPISFRR